MAKKQVQEQSGSMVANPNVVKGAMQPEASKTAKVKSNRAKASGKGVTVSYEGQGVKDANRMFAAENAADAERCAVLMGLEYFAKFGWGQTEGKRRKFGEATETYFAGWKKVKESLPEAQQGALQVRISEARRVMGAFLTIGNVAVNAILEGQGTYHKKIAALPKIDGTAATPRAPKAKEDKSQIAALAQAEKEQRVQIVAKFTDKDIAEVLGGLTEPQLVSACHALASRLTVTKDKALHHLGEILRKEMAALDAEAAKAVA